MKKQHQNDAARATEIAPLLPAIYEAATDATRWPEAFAGVVRLLDGNKGLIFSHQATPEQKGIWVPCRITQEDMRRYVERYHAFDVWMQRGQELGVFVPGNVMTGDDLLPREEFLASVFYREFLSPHDIYDGCWGILHDGSEPDIPIMNVAIYRPKTSPAFGEPEKALLRALVPHLREATRIGFRLGALEQRAGILQTAVDSLSPALVLLDAQGTVVFCNGRAQTLLANNDKLRLVEGRLTVEGRQKAGFEALLKASATEETLLGIARSHGTPDLWLIRVPLPPAGNAPPDARRAAVALMIHDATALDTIDLESFARVHGLTPAEARILNLLLEHASLPPIAQALGVTLHTVLAQLRAIREKTGAHRQAELVRMLMSWPRRLG